jgi:uncharacterized membrane protein YphA (DoxX/SURF4 family)
MENKLIIPEKYKKLIVETCRVILGLVFIFSGFVKAVDPLGFTYKIQDYLLAFGLDFFSFLALPASIFLAALEFILGVCLLVGVYRKVVSFLVMALMCFMTPLTLYLAITNPVTDCGCFGDAWVITNWETFFKNLFLLPASILVFIWCKQMTCLFSKRSRSLVALYTTLFIVGVALYSYLYLPILDFRPYKIGNNIIELMTIPEGAPTDEFVTTFIYEKDGEQREFSIDNYPKGDSGWTFVSAKSELIKKGYEPPIHDLLITDEDENDITDIILEDPNYTFLLIAYNLKKANDSNIDKINAIYDYANRYNYNFYALTFSTPTEINDWKLSTGAEYPFYTVNDITLKTIIRSNPGLVLMHDATIINKWSDRNLPTDQNLILPLEESKLAVAPTNQDVRKVIFLALILFVPLALLGIWDSFKKEKIIV